MPTVASRIGGLFRPKIILIVLVAVAILYGAHRLGAGPILKNALDWIRGLGALVSIAATLGATAAFVVGRYFARDWIARKLEGNAKFKAIDEAVGREGWKIVLLTRLSPVFPFNLLNYAYGLTRVRLRDYVFASWAGMI